MKKRSRMSYLTIGGCLLAVGCTSTTKIDPMTADDYVEREEREAQEPNLVKIEDAATLFTTLDQNMRSWREYKIASDEDSKLRLVSIEGALTRLVVVFWCVVVLACCCVDQLVSW